jgi:leucyl aminopeptidase
MANIKLSNITADNSSNSLLDLKASLYSIFVHENFSLNVFDDIEKIYAPLKKIVKDRNFKGKKNEHILITGELDKNPVYISILGIGNFNNKKYSNIQNYREAIGNLVKTSKSLNIDKVALHIPELQNFGITLLDLFKESTIIINLANYEYDRFISTKEKKDLKDTKYILFNNNKQYKIKDIKLEIEKGEIIAYGINQTRYWVDTPPSLLTPDDLTKDVKNIAKDNNLELKIFDKKDLEKMNMQGILGVSSGSTKEPKLLVIEHIPNKKKGVKLALVGKGITFDSGGLSLKPANAMETMKGDMAGAASVISLIEAIKKLNLNINIVALTPLCENMPDGNALKPGDVLTFYNGKTAEIKNTDAEGRLILADALSYAVKNYDPEIIVDIATLTGACAYALGPLYSGIFSHDEELINQFYKASISSGDKIWRLPLDEEYKVAIKSDIADISNIGNAKYTAGAITAALFLENFVDNKRWVHLDIAGASFAMPNRSYLKNGASGTTVRLLIDFINSIIE